MPRCELCDSDYQVLGEFRRRLRVFLHFSEEAALAEGLEPRQHQLMLEVRAVGEAEGVTVGQLAERLLVRPHSAAELIDRLAEKTLVARVRGGGDRRQVRVRLTREGEKKLKRLSIAHRAELREAAPALVAALRRLMANRPGGADG